MYTTVYTLGRYRLTQKPRELSVVEITQYFIVRYCSRRRFGFGFLYDYVTERTFLFLEKHLQNYIF
jgi:hypothetical protein